jgi:tRNA pseudouridine38-40 synthase
VSEKANETFPRSFRLVLEYDGRDFEGWQLQSGPRTARTVQGVLLAAARSITSSEARVRGAGRTDAGVHAMAQVASLRVATDLPVEALLRALNARLPEDVAVRSIAEVPGDWDALREARRKHYRYQIWNGMARSPLRAARWAWIREPLSVEAMREAGRAFLGRHDFAALQGVGSSVQTTVRTILALRIEGRTDGQIVLDVEGEGFLRHMVRNLAGTLIEIGRGRWAPEQAASILASRDRGQAGPTAPAHGLILVEVHDSWSDSCSASRSASGSGGGDRACLSVDDGGPVG